MNTTRFFVIVSIILAAAASRLIPHPPNFAPITAIALFSGAYLSNRRLAMLVPISALLISDLALGFYRGMWIVYATFSLIVCIGFFLRNRNNVAAIASATLGSSIMFFAITNLGVWGFGSLYPKTTEGLIACFVAALPFFQNTLLGDAFYVAVLFGGLRIAEWKWPMIQVDSRGMRAT